MNLFIKKLLFLGIALAILLGPSVSSAQPGRAQDILNNNIQQGEAIDDLAFERVRFRDDLFEEKYNSDILPIIDEKSRELQASAYAVFPAVVNIVNKINTITQKLSAIGIPLSSTTGIPPTPLNLPPGVSAFDTISKRQNIINCAFHHGGNTSISTTGNCVFYNVPASQAGAPASGLTTTPDTNSLFDISGRPNYALGSSLLSTWRRLAGSYATATGPVPASLPITSSGSMAQNTLTIDTANVVLGDGYATNFIYPSGTSMAWLQGLFRDLHNKTVFNPNPALISQGNFANQVSDPHQFEDEYRLLREAYRRQVGSAGINNVDYPCGRTTLAQCEFVEEEEFRKAVMLQLSKLELEVSVFRDNIINFRQAIQAYIHDVNQAIKYYQTTLEYDPSEDY